MIDLHCHILPCLDDGPDSLELSLEMAKQAVAEGITGVIATPHCIQGLYFSNGTVVLAAVAEFKEALAEAGINLDIWPGAEVRIELETAKDIASGSVLTLCNLGKHVLLEFPLGSVPPNVGQVIFELMLAGVRPIIAHPERNKEILAEPQLLSGLIEKGCLVQVTAGSLTGDFGSQVQEFTKEIIGLGWVHFVASDAHDHQRRPLKLREALVLTEQSLGAEGAREIFVVNPLKVTRGEMIALRESLPYIRKKQRSGGKKGFWSGLRKYFK